MKNPLTQMKARACKAAHLLQDALTYRPALFGFVGGSYRSGTTAMADWFVQQSGVTSFSESRLMIAAHAMMSQVRKFRSLHKSEAMIAEDMRQMLFGYYARRRNYHAERVLIDKEPLGPIALPERNYAAFLGSVRTIFPDVRLNYDEPRSDTDSLVDDSAGLRSQLGRSPGANVFTRGTHRELVRDR